MAKEKYRFKERKFLNDDVTRRAYIMANVPDSTDVIAKMKKGERPYTEIQFDVADCSRTIYLAFSIESPKERKEALRKADILFETIKGFREALYEEAALMEEALDKKGRVK